MSTRVRIVTERRRRRDRPLVEIVGPSRTGETVLDAAGGQAAREAVQAAIAATVAATSAATTAATAG